MTIPPSSLFFFSFFRAEGQREKEVGDWTLQLKGWQWDDENWPCPCCFQRCHSYVGHRHYSGSELAEVTPVHLLYTLGAFSSLLAKQTFLFLHTFMLILWFLKLDSVSYGPEFPRQPQPLSAAAVWQTDNKAFQFTSPIFALILFSLKTPLFFSSSACSFFFLPLFFFFFPALFILFLLSPTPVI